MSENHASLPYHDAKPVGAADFYYAINATFRFILGRMGTAGLQRYWTDLGRRYYAPVSARWRAGGLAEVARYWQDFFSAEPGAEVQVSQQPDEVLLEVRSCPAIKHLRAAGRQIVPCYCQHCYFVSDAIGESAGLTVRLRGGNGSCTQRFLARRAELPPQQLTDIEECP